jgi:hypothetical protein
MFSFLFTLAFSSVFGYHVSDNFPCAPCWNASSAGAFLYSAQATPLDLSLHLRHFAQLLHWSFTAYFSFVLTEYSL